MSPKPLGASPSIASTMVPAPSLPGTMGTLLGGHSSGKAPWDEGRGLHPQERRIRSVWTNPALSSPFLRQGPKALSPQGPSADIAPSGFSPSRRGASKSGNRRAAAHCSSSSPQEALARHILRMDGSREELALHSSGGLSVLVNGSAHMSQVSQVPHLPTHSAPLASSAPPWSQGRCSGHSQGCSTAQYAQHPLANPAGSEHPPRMETAIILQMWLWLLQPNLVQSTPTTQLQHQRVSMTSTTPAPAPKCLQNPTRRQLTGEDQSREERQGVHSASGVKEKTRLSSSGSRDSRITDNPGRHFWGQVTCGLSAPPSLHLLFSPHPQEASQPEYCPPGPGASLPFLHNSEGSALTSKKKSERPRGVAAPNRHCHVRPPHR